jgi:predicted metal-dependent hydrolase
MQADDAPLLIAFCGDLFFTSRITSTGEGLGYIVQTIARVEEIVPDESGVPARQSAASLDGPGAALLEQLTLKRPSLIVFDLNNHEIPWRDWIVLIKTSPATRRIPILCFGAHREVEVMNNAKSAGADVVVARAQFVEALGDLIQKYARRIDHNALRQACQQPLTKIALRGLEEFNQGQFFEAHETLETAWNMDTTPGRELYRAILQVAVAYLQIERGNYPGAMKMFLRLRQWIDPLPETCRGVNVAQLRADAWQAREALIALGKDRIGEFDRKLFKPVIYHD